MRAAVDDIEMRTGSGGVTPAGANACHGGTAVLAPRARYTAIEIPMMALAPASTQGVAR